MATRQDISLLNNHIYITNNDLVWVDSDEQHIADTINACAGWWKESFADGVGILTYLKGRNVIPELTRSMNINLKSDKYNAKPIIAYDSTGTLIVDANVSI